MKMTVLLAQLMVYILAETLTHTLAQTAMIYVNSDCSNHI